MPHSDLPRRVGSPAHTRSILKDFSQSWKARERERLADEKLKADFRDAALLLALTLHECQEV